MAVEDVDPCLPPDEPASIPVADLRGVPLKYLGRDADALDLVRRVMGSLEGSSRVGVAMFSSSI